MSFSSPPQPPPSGLNADTARVRQRQSDDRAARDGRARSRTPESIQRLTSRVRTALRARRSST
jgi:hypothetical protein